MQLIQFQIKYGPDDSFENFRYNYFSGQMPHLASDLLDKGLTPQEIVNAVRRAMVISRTAGLDVQCHFQPLYTTYEGMLVRDCKMTSFGLALVLLNAKANLPEVASMQVEMLRCYFEKSNGQALQ
jgi:hypothetical protein